MRAGRTHQPLSYDIRLPDEAQADALRLLDASRSVANEVLVQLWPSLDEFMAEYPGPAWKQVGELIGSPQPHGDRQWRCESETAGRILRAQAERKRLFQQVLPLLSEGFIRPETDRRPAGKHRGSIKEAIDALQKRLEDDESSFVALQNIVEQCCNHYFEHDRFPQSYEEMQAVPLLKVGLLTYAGDDGGSKGQAYRLAVDAEAGTASLRFRFPDEQGVWRWRTTDVVITLPEIVKRRLSGGERLAPALREHRHPDGSRVAVLDFILELPKAPLPAWGGMERVLGADWGVHTLLTASLWIARASRSASPSFWILAVLMGDRRARGGRYGAAGAIIAITRPSAGKSGGCFDTNATCLVYVSVLSALAAPPIPAPGAASLPRRIALQMSARKQ